MQNRIREQIIRAGKTQKEVAELLGISKVGLCQLASVEMPKFETFSRVASVLNIPTWRLCLSDDEIEDVYNTFRVQRKEATPAIREVANVDYSRDSDTTFREVKEGVSNDADMDIHNASGGGMSISKDDKPAECVGGERGNEFRCPVCGASLVASAAQD